MVLINGYNETVHRGPFQLYRIRWIADGGLGFDLCAKHYKTHHLSAVGSRSDALDASRAIRSQPLYLPIKSTYVLMRSGGP